MDGITGMDSGVSLRGPSRWRWSWLLLLLAAPLTPRTVSGQETEGQVSVLRLEGPRIGLTIVGGEVGDRLKEDYDAGPLLMQFGWQWERAFRSFTDGGATPVTELVFLVGGAEQGTFVPSLTWLVGVRSARGTEFGIGPNLSPAGAALAFAAGITHRAGELNIPFNVAVVPSKRGMRLSLLTGFNARLR